MVSMALALGCLVGLGWLAVRRDDEAGAFPAALAALVGGLIGARLGFVAVHLPYFQARPNEIAWLWAGGLSAAGGALGGLAGTALSAALRRKQLLPIADRLAAPSLAVALAAWIGTTLDGSVYGVSVVPNPLSPPAPDIFGRILPRWPTATAGILATGLLLAGLLVTEERPWRSGLRAAAALGGLASVSLGLSFTRADPVLLFYGIRIEVAAMGLVLAAATALAAWSLRSARVEAKA